MAKELKKTRTKAASVRKTVKSKAKKQTRRSAKSSADQVAPAAQLMSNLDLYFQEVKAYSLLTRDEECELARGIHANDNESLHKLVKANLRFVVSIAKEYAHYGVPLEDLINEGNLGLLKAAQRFDETRGFKFISYAVWWIRQSILAAVFRFFSLGIGSSSPEKTCISFRWGHPPGQASGVGWRQARTPSFTISIPYVRKI